MGTSGGGVRRKNGKRTNFKNQSRERAIKLLNTKTKDNNVWKMVYILKETGSLQIHFDWIRFGQNI